MKLPKLFIFGSVALTGLVCATAAQADDHRRHNGDSRYYNRDRHEYRDHGHYYSQQRYYYSEPRYYYSQPAVVYDNDYGYYQGGNSGISIAFGGRHYGHRHHHHR